MQLTGLTPKKRDGQSTIKLASSQHRSKNLNLVRQKQIEQIDRALEFYVILSMETS